MESMIATALEHRVTRISLALAHLVICLIFGPYVLITGLIGIVEHNAYFLAAAVAGIIGLVAWPLRLFTTRATLLSRPNFRRALAAGLLAGVAAALYAAFGPLLPSPVWLFVAVAAIGTVMAFGTIYIAAEA